MPRPIARPSATAFLPASFPALLASVGLAGSAFGQCSVYRIDMPDFDQRRAALPNDGRMYCVPTATANALAYISNHGYPDVMGGPRDWSSSAQYGPVSTQLTILGGILMGTNPTTGTSISGWTAGTKAMLDGSNGLIVGCYLAAGFQGLSPHQLADQMRIGSVVMPLIGWYDDVGLGRWTRDGGHMVTMWAAFNTCDSDDDMLMAFHDPGNDSVLTSQSAFRTTISDFGTSVTWKFKRKNESAHLPRRVMRVDAYGSSPTGFLDGVAFIMPLFGLTSDPGLNDISFDLPKPGSDEPEAKRFTIEMPTGYQIEGMMSTPLPSEAFALASTDSGRLGQLIHVNFATAQTTTIDTMTSPKAMTVGRDGSAYVAAVARLDRYAMQADGTQGIIGTTPLPAAADALFYDDAADEVLVLNIAGRRLMRTSQDLSTLRNDAIPTAVPLIGDGSIAIDPTDGFEWIASSGSPTLSKLGRDAAQRLVVESQVVLPGVASPQALQFGDDGTLFVVDGGIIKAFENLPRGGWTRADSPLDGLPSGPVFMAGRGRTNYDPATMADINILPPDGDPGQPDCRADLDLDGRLSIFDFLAFQNLFDRGSTWADFDHDGALTIFDFLAFQNAFDAGCP